MQKYFKQIIIILILVLIGTNIYLFFIYHKPNPKEICFKNNCFTFEIARTPRQKALGLMNRDLLDQTASMLFIYEDPKTMGIWMKNMKFPLDILWLNYEGEIVDFIKNAPPCQPNLVCPAYKPAESASYVLEINAGLIDKYSLELGNKAKFYLAN
ncbi:MAG: DUF192 domain-containing protein [Patescibacteria group bacterium]